MNASRTSGALPLQTHTDTHTLLILRPADECPPLSLGHWCNSQLVFKDHYTKTW